MHPDDLDSEELLTYVREGAAHIERFVKQLAITPSGGRLYDYINELGALGLPDPAAESLHTIRKAANLGKHDAAAALTLQQVLQTVEDARDAVAEVGVTGSAPGCDAAESPRPPRTFTVLLADYPTGGEVDYEVCTLLDDGRIVTLDHYQLRFDDEEAVVAALATSGRLDRDPSTEPVARLRAMLEGSSELSGIWQYDGDLRDIVKAFGSYQHSEAIPDLQRDASVAAVRSAIVMAIVDLGGAASTAAETVVNELNERYAMRGPLAESLAARVAQLVVDSRVATLDGPRFVSHRRFEVAAARAVARDLDLGIAITGDGVVFVDMGSGYTPMP